MSTITWDISRFVDLNILIVQNSSGLAILAYVGACSDNCGLLDLVMLDQMTHVRSTIEIQDG